jgi:hypothetical protein
MIAPSAIAAGTASVLRKVDVLAGAAASITAGTLRRSGAVSFLWDEPRRNRCELPV